MKRQASFTFDSEELRKFRAICGKLMPDNMGLILERVSSMRAFNERYNHILNLTTSSNRLDEAKRSLRDEVEKEENHHG